MSVESTLNEIRQGFEFSYTADKREEWRSKQQLVSDLLDGVLEDDCDGFALYCWHECRDRGLKARLVFCRTETGGGHLVCEHDGWVLDNRYTWVRSKDELPYTWISISGYSPGEAWHRVTNNNKERVK